MLNQKAVFIGEPASGKSSLLLTLGTGAYPEDDTYLTACHVVDNISLNVFVDFKPICLSLWDTPSQSDYDRLRPLSYPQADFFCICIDISDVDAFYNDRVRSKWLPEIKHHIPEAELVVIGTKADLRWQINKQTFDTNIPLIPTEQLKCLATSIGATGYIELSAKYMDDNQIKQVIEEILKMGFFASRSGYRRYKGMRLPNNKLNNNKYKSVNTDDIKSGLLVTGYVHNKYIQLIPKEIIILIHSYYAIPNIIYHKTNASSFNSRQHEGSKYWIMFWIDLVALILHNVSFLAFSIQLFVTYGDILSIFALIFSCIECVIILAGYYWLFHPKTDYYTEAMIRLHIPFELLVNLPMIIIHMVYLLEIDDKSQLIQSFYISISIYFLYGIYKYCVSGMFWSHLNDLLWESDWIKCVCAHFIIGLTTMLSMFILSLIYMVKNIKNGIAIAIFVLSILSCFAMCFMMVIQMSSLPRSRGTGRPYNIDLNHELKADSKYIDCMDYTYSINVNEFNDIEFDIEMINKWIDQGLSEHASIATFNKFSLELMNIGAPLWMIQLSNKAVLDEIKHTKISFDIVNILNIFNERCITFDTFPSHTIQIDSDWNKISIDTAIGGCFSETISALNMNQIKYGNIIDQYLYQIAMDEIRHSALAWITVKFMMDNAVNIDVTDNHWWHNQLMQHKQLAIGNKETYIYDTVIPSILDIIWKHDHDYHHQYEAIMKQLHLYFNLFVGAITTDVNNINQCNKSIEE